MTAVEVEKFLRRHPDFSGNSLIFWRISSLFGNDASDVASCALIPLQHAGLRGVLAIGSRNPTCFQPGMGFLFLTQMGEIVSARLVALLDGQA